MTFEMDPGEIVREYRTAANKTKIVRILADRNLCSGRDIAEFLAGQGEELTKAWADALRKERVPGRSRRVREACTEAPAEPPTEQPPSGQRTPISDLELRKALADAIPTKDAHGVTAGALREILSGLPEDCPVMLDGAPAQYIFYVREYLPERGKPTGMLLIS